MAYKEDIRHMGHEQRVAEGFMAPKATKATKATVNIRNIRTGRVTTGITQREAEVMVARGTYEIVTE